MKVGAVPRSSVVIVLCILFCSPLFGPGVSSGEPLYGDVNQDQLVDLKDAVLTFQIVSGIDAEGPFNLEAGVLGDEKIGLADAVYVLQVVASLRPSPARRGFVLIPPTPNPNVGFTMGDDTSDSLDERPTHPVAITQAFWMSKYEVTQKEWFDVMGTRPWLDAGGQPKAYVRVGDDYPATYVTWVDVQAFMLAKGPDYRLPTEAEWEYACRAGTKTKFYFGDDPEDLGDYAIYRENSWNEGRQYAHMVGLKRPNAWGLYDMHGNVWEWCQDWYGPYVYQQLPQEDPAGPDFGEARVVRGGSFADPDPADSCRSAKRAAWPPTEFKYADVGFRLVYKGTEPPE